ncbi:unnamed protein product [Protopolystoma xenopodis]|uniref:PHD-type domain-containing protein n=1 Tax=Protopolystoma xenopodis TaxID=117903 RepID=A0A448XN33_9PLAT|nr:unnamed protein product [Protopolystoma xenopodis]
MLAFEGSASSRPMAAPSVLPNDQAFRSGPLGPLKTGITPGPSGPVSISTPVFPPPPPYPPSSLLPLGATCPVCHRDILSMTKSSCSGVSSKLKDPSGVPGLPSPTGTSTSPLASAPVSPTLAASSPLAVSPSSSRLSSPIPPVQCDAGCRAWYHLACSGLTLNALCLLRAEPLAEWLCPRCAMTGRTLYLKASA